MKRALSFIARADRQVLPFQRPFQIGQRDFIPAVEHRPALVGRDIDENTAGDQRADVLDPEPGQAFRFREFGRTIAVVIEIADPDVSETIELRPDLPQLAADDLVVVVGLVGPVRSEHLRNAQAVVPGPEHRHTRLVHTSHLVRLSAHDEVLCLEHLGGRHPVGGTTLILGSPP
jgi:hypothetical protein